MPNNVPYLCGGIFFGLLLQARKNRTKARDKQKGGSDGLSDADVMRGLVYVVTGEKVDAMGKTFAKATSQYKTCQISESTYIPFKDTVTVNAFDNSVKSNNPDTLNRMSEFIEEYLNAKKHEWLAKALLEVIKNDVSIPEKTEIYCEEKAEILKSKIDKITTMDFRYFLISTLRFILTTRPDNELGKDTFNSWYSRESSHAEWKFCSDIGINIRQYIDFLMSGSYTFSFSAKKALLNKDALSGATHVGGFTSLVAGMLKNEEAPFANYLERAKLFYSKVKTLFYSETPKEFYDFYVCNSLQMPISVTYNTSDPAQPAVIDNITGAMLNALPNCVIISGTGGIGKSMMMRHLLLSAIKEYEQTEQLPILISLKNYSSDCDLKTFVYQTVKAIDYTVQQDQIEGLLEDGNCILLLDGLDEISSSLRERFEAELEHMTIRFPDNHYVISSRPTNKFFTLKRFSVFKINEFSKEQSLALIDKLDYHNVEAKAKFRADLDKRLYKSHQQFASNPLLLTIMLMTYSSIGDIPGKMHIFYAKAFETMARLHDATKGAYKRPLHTNIEPEEFAEYFAEFCARTYLDEVLEFSALTFNNYMEEVIAHQCKPIKFTARDFLLDLKDNLCIMYEEGEKFYFIHRSFQEYFTAVFFSQQMDDKLPMISEQFKELRQKSYHDKTFDMLYDMIPKKIDRYVFVPYLKDLWHRCDEAAGYWTFLELQYPTIFSYVGDTVEWNENIPEDYFYDFIVNENLLRQNGQLDDVDWPIPADFFKKEFATIWIEDDFRSKQQTVEFGSFEYCEYERRMDEDYEPDFCGTSWEVEVSEVLKNKEKYKELIAFMESDEFPLKKEYDSMRAYSEQLFTSFDTPKKAVKKNLFDFL